MKNIPEDLSNKIKIPLQTPANNADPKMAITVVRAKDTIMDNTYWTTEVIRTGMDLGDVSVAPRRFTPYGSPNRIYEIHVQNGIVSTSIREYPDKLEEGWKEQFTLGPGKSVGIAFDGEWERYKQTYRLVTYEKPWISWVDLNGILWTQKWDEEDTKLQLSTDVVKVRMIRAWKNTAIEYLDQGIVAAYIRTDGKVYYRNFCIQENYTEAWEYEKQLNGFTGVAVNVNLFITNDYRMGFIVEDTAGEIHWLVTHRNWGGMASPAENLISGVKDLEFDVTAIDTYTVHTPSIVPAPEPPASSIINPDKLRLIPDEKLSTTVRPLRVFVCPPSIPRIPDITGVERLAFTDNKTIRISFNYELACELDALMPHINIVTTSGKLLEIDQLEQSENDLTIKMVEEMRDMDNLMLTYTEVGSYYIAMKVNDTCVIDYGKAISLSILGRPPEVQENLSVFIDATFTVIDILETKMYEEEHLIAGVSDLTFTVTEVDTIGVDFKEHVTAKISDVTFTVTQTGTSPI